MSREGSQESAKNNQIGSGFKGAARAPIIITGGGQRVGLACAEYFVSKGIPVVVTYRTKREGVEKLHSMGVACIEANFATDAGVNQCIHSIKERFPRIRAIIHNASDWIPEKKGLAPADLLSKMMQVHVSTPYQMNLALRDLLNKNNDVEGKADIIHMTDYVVDTGSAKHLAYAASKAALANLTLSFSALLAPQVKVNSIAPALLAFNEHDDEEYKKKALAKSLMQITPGFNEAVQAIDFLLNSEYVTGRTIHLDGGRHLK